MSGTDRSRSRPQRFAQWGSFIGTTLAIGTAKEAAKGGDAPREVGLDDGVTGCELPHTWGASAPSFARQAGKAAESFAMYWRSPDPTKGYICSLEECRLCCVVRVAAGGRRAMSRAASVGSAAPASRAAR